MSKVIEAIKSLNPYPEDIFPDRGYQDAGSILQAQGVSPESVFAKFGRQVWALCVEKFEEATGWVESCEHLPEIGDQIIIETHSGQIHFAIYTDDDEFDVNMPGPDGHRANWYKFTHRTCIRWRLITNTL